MLDDLIACNKRPIRLTFYIVYHVEQHNTTVLQILVLKDSIKCSNPIYILFLKSVHIDQRALGLFCRFLSLLLCVQFVRYCAALFAKGNDAAGGKWL